MKRIIATILAAIFILSGCVITGPYVSREEIDETRERLKLKSLTFQFKQIKKIDEIGNNIINSLPKEDRRGSYPYLGLYTRNIDKYLKKLFNLNISYGVVVVVISKESPAEVAGIREGDVVIALNNKRIRSQYDINRIINSSYGGQAINIEVIRENERLNFKPVLAEKHIKVNFNIVDIAGVNAAASSESIVVTYDLMRFSRSDSEIAVILGHELAHITKGHIGKSAGFNIITGLLAMGAGMFSESQSPGTGDSVARSATQIANLFSRKYSRDLEREADYFGLRYVYYAGYDIEAGAEVWERFAIEVPKSMIGNFLSTHPTSVERLLRIEKTIGELKKSG